jgi:hypothetical protein
VRVLRWDGAEWVGVGGEDGPPSADGASVPSLSIAEGGTVFVAWIEPDVGGFDAVRVAQGSGAGWTVLGGAVNPPAFNALGQSQRMMLAVGADGAPVVAYGAFDFGVGVEVRRWDGSGWGVLGATLAATPDTRVQGVALDLARGSTSPLLAWSDSAGGSTYHVRRFDGVAWAPVGDEEAFNAGAATLVSVSIADAVTPFAVTNTSRSNERTLQAWRYGPE